MSDIDVETAVAWLLDGDEDSLLEQVDTLLANGHSVSDIVLRYLSAVAAKLGAYWVEDLCSFADVTLGMSSLHTILRSKASRLSEEIEPVGAGLSILIAPLPGQTHVFGASVVEEFFRAADWDVKAGIYENDAGYLDALASERFDVVGLSIGAERSLGECHRLIAATRSRSLNADIKILVGGPLLAVEPAYAETLGADATATDALNALKTAFLIVGGTH